VSTQLHTRPPGWGDPKRPGRVELLKKERAKRELLKTKAKTKQYRPRSTGSSAQRG
jgi:hypothetical protein